MCVCDFACFTPINESYIYHTAELVTVNNNAKKRSVVDKKQQDNTVTVEEISKKNVTDPAELVGSVVPKHKGHGNDNKRAAGVDTLKVSVSAEQIIVKHHKKYFRIRDNMNLQTTQVAVR